MTGHDRSPTPEDEEYIDRHEKHPYEYDFDTNPPTDDPYWYPEKPNSSDTVWRYMDLAKFISILQNDALWFSHHSNFDDPYDGKYSEKTIEKIKEDYGELGLDPPSSIDEDSDLSYYNYVSCWNIKDEQSVGLWNMYFKGEIGVAIKTSIEKLEDAVSEPNVDFRGYSTMSGKVDYCSVDDEPRGYYGPIFSKRPIFDFENEFRIVFSTLSSQDGNETDDESSLSTKGIPVSVDVDTLIDEVYVSPEAGGYVKQVLEDLKDCSEIEFNFTITQSALFSHPQTESED